MVSCQEPSPLKGSKHSLQHHPHDAALVNVHSFMSMGVEARCPPCHNAAHCWHMKMQSSHHHCCLCRGRCNCDCHCCLLCCCRCQLRCRHHCPCPSPLPLLSDIAIAVSVAHHCRRLFHVAVSHCRCCFHCHRPLLSLSPLAIAVAFSVGHHRRCRCWPFPRVVALAQ